MNTKAYEIIDSVDKLQEAIARVRLAQKQFATYDQEQVDKIFLAAASAADKARISLAKLAVEETGMGVVEDKVIKNHYAAEYIYNAYKNTKTCGVLEEDKVYGMHPHNQIMQNWQEYGIIGLFTILGLFISLLLASRRSLSLSLIILIILVQLQTEVIDGGITTVGFCMYVYLILALLKSDEMGKEKISSLKWISRSPGNA
jgi:sensor histidine kinase YesM